SAQLHSQQLFDRIKSDLEDPATALGREGRRVGRRRPRYEIRSLVNGSDLFGDEPTDFIIRSELHGVPQRRHRLILVGILRDGLTLPTAMPAERSAVTPMRAAIVTLPRLRSGLSKEEDSSERWLTALRASSTRAWLRQVPSELRRRILETIYRIRAPL